MLTVLTGGVAHQDVFSRFSLFLFVHSLCVCVYIYLGYNTYSSHCQIKQLKRVFKAVNYCNILHRIAMQFCSSLFQKVDPSSRVTVEERTKVIEHTGNHY